MLRRKEKENGDVEKVKRTRGSRGIDRSRGLNKSKGIGGYKGLGKSKGSIVGEGEWSDGDYDNDERYSDDEYEGSRARLVDESNQVVRRRKPTEMLPSFSTGLVDSNVKGSIPMNIDSGEETRILSAMLESFSKVGMFVGSISSRVQIVNRRGGRLM